MITADYFEKLPSRSPEAYAIAYEKYREMICAAYDFEEDEINTDLDSIQLNFPVRLGFRAMNTEKRGVVLGETSDEKLKQKLDGV